ncbi:hypothetical protein [Deinococcus radiotolerans]|uniref:Uncharacterized protein n=1 Tax=Deinococcus radiotolerans TaxID=1309407 RepID=A0ABQ2FFT6_9DEIO|nr:hypothetical protein [Deinococcus radiotolerans]GGK86403.1 hypothetical protein GCM10010844_01080 [Deinococcus radiotolerans]
MDDPTILAELLRRVNHDPAEGLEVALDAVQGQPHPRVAAIAAHLSATKRDLWTRIAHATGTSSPPDDAGLHTLLTWEEGAAASLTAAHLDVTVPPADPASAAGEPAMTVAALLRLNAALTTGRAAQIRRLAGQPRLA